MKQITLSLSALLFFSTASFAQIKQSALKTTPLFTTVNVSEANASNAWNITLRTVVSKPHSFGKLDEVKRQNMLEKFAQKNRNNQTQNKTRGAKPTIGKSFRGNDLKGFTPSDNGIAIGNNGMIVSVINQNFEVYDTNGNKLVTQAGWNNFLGADSTSLIRGKFDPRVLYDPHHDRFILCILHAPVDTFFTSNIVAFSQSNDPTQGWNIYNLDGNPLKNNSWTDYPSMGITEYELFINANLFEPAPNYNYNGTYIQQIDLDSAYAGGTLQFKTWSGFNDSIFITLNPAPNGLMTATGGRNMNFIMLNPGQDTLVHFLQITDTMNAIGVAVINTQATIPYYSACADELIQDPITNNIDTLSTGSAWIHNAYTLNNFIHFTFSANMSGDCGIHYGRYNLGTQQAQYVSYSEPTKSLAYPAIAPLGYSNSDKNAAIVFLRANITTLPEVAIITVDDNMNWSQPTVVKAGETIVDILPLPNHERWGDYTGIARKYNAAKPEVWLFGCFSANTPPRNKSWGNWIAQIGTNDYPVAVDNITKSNTVTVYPNPTRDTYALVFNLEKNSMVQVLLIDINGRKIKSLFEGQLPASRNELSFDRNALSNGQYFLQVYVDGDVQTKKLIVVE